MTNLKEYLLRAEKTSKYRIKSIRPIEDAQMDVIEKVLKKYRPKEVTRPKKLMFQTNPLDFAGAKNVEVWFIDAELNIPVSATMLKYELDERLGLKLDSAALVVVAEEDPRSCCMDEDGDEAENNEPQDEEGKALLNDPHYKEVQSIDTNDYYGSEYNKKLTDYLKRIQDERKNDPAHAGPNGEGEPTGDAKDFNADVPVAKAKYSTLKASAHKAGPLETGKQPSDGKVAYDKKSEVKKPMPANYANSYKKPKK